MKVNYVLMYGTPYLKYREFETFEDVSKYLVNKCIVNYSIFNSITFFFICQELFFVFSNYFKKGKNSDYLHLVYEVICPTCTKKGVICYN